MSVIAVVNPKGGVGKSTLSTNLAGYFAAKGESSALGDLDPQRSSHAWLGIRPDSLPPIERWMPLSGNHSGEAGAGSNGASALSTASETAAWSIGSAPLTRPSFKGGVAVLDTPAAMSAEMLHDVTALADRVIVPLQPSIFDIYAVHQFLEVLAREKHIKRRKIEIGVVGMRVDARTKAAEELQRFVEGLDLPVLAYLRDTQNYIQLAAHGMTLWDVAPSRVEKDLEQWDAITQWLAKTA